MTILDRIIQYKRLEEVPARMSALPLESVQAQALAAPPALDFIAALRRPPGVALIAEVKQASPSRGVLRPGFDPLELAAAYALNGAAAISVLTDAPFFQGCLEDLQAIRRQHPSAPLLRKDFIVHPYQVYESRAAGADALLLIAATLSQEDLAMLLALANDLGMAALVEVHDQAELERVLPLSPRLVGANNRNLHDFSVDLDTCLSLRPRTPAGVCFVAESGIHTSADIARLSLAHIDAMLIGEALLTSPDVAARVKEFVITAQNPTLSPRPLNGEIR